MKKGFVLLFSLLVFGLIIGGTRPAERKVVCPAWDAGT